MEIDMLRGVSIILTIMIHTNAYFLSQRVAYITLELSQFVVVFFIFCSAYLFFQRPFVLTISTFISYIKKRVVRLILPYFVFLFFYLILVFMADRAQITSSYVLKNIFLTGGVEFNWLVLLFVELALLFPLISHFEAKHPLILHGYTILSFISALVFLKYTPLPYFRYVMWLPWSLIPIFTLYFVRYVGNGWFLAATLFVSSILFSLSQFFLLSSKHSLQMYSNKYPPNIYHLSYGVAFLIIFYLAAKKGLFSFSPVQKVVHFFSVNSYPIYFIHVLITYALIVFVRARFTWISFFLVVAGATAIAQMILNKILFLWSQKKA